MARGLLPGGGGAVLVTGAAGFIGAHLVDALAERGCSVTGIDNERSGDWSRVSGAGTQVNRDLCELTEAELAELCAGADVVFHLAAEKYNSSKSTPQRVLDTNVIATQRLFDAAGRAGAGKVVFASSLYAYGSLGPDPMRESDLPAPTTLYGVSKVTGEQMLRVARRDHDLHWAVARLFFVYGPRQFAEGGYKSVIVSNFERLRRGERPTIFGDGEQALDYVFVEDAVAALIALGSPDVDETVLNVASGNAVTVNALTSAMLEVAESNAEPMTCPPDWTAGTRRVGDPARAERELGWKAAITLHDGLRRAWDWTKDTSDG